MPSAAQTNPCGCLPSASRLQRMLPCAGTLTKLGLSASDDNAKAMIK
jgi:hypothetical protein